MGNFCQGSYSKFFFNIPAHRHKAKIPRGNMHIALFGSTVTRLLYLILLSVQNSVASGRNGSYIHLIGNWKYFLNSAKPVSSDVDNVICFHKIGRIFYFKK